MEVLLTRQHLKDIGKHPVELQIMQLRNNVARIRQHKYFEWYKHKSEHTARSPSHADLSTFHLYTVPYLPQEDCKLLEDFICINPYVNVKLFMNKNQDSVTYISWCEIEKDAHIIVLSEAECFQIFRMPDLISGHLNQLKDRRFDIYYNLDVYPRFCIPRTHVPILKLFTYLESGFTSATTMFNNPGRLVMGPGTHEIDMELFALNRRRLVNRLHSVNAPNDSVVLLKGGCDFVFNDTDVEFLFRQESYFMWTFGVLEPDFYGAISVNTGTSYLFMPRLPTSYGIFMGPIAQPKDAQAKYKVDEVHYVDDMSTVLKKLQPSALLILQGTNTDSGLKSAPINFDGVSDFTLNKNVLYNEMADLRVVKTQLEICAMRYVIQTSSSAHRKVMRMSKPGKSEYQCEAEFMFHCYHEGGCRSMSYICVCASGANGRVLHYGHAGAPNTKVIRDGDICLYDMGANYFGYCADITCTFPANGKFTPKQKLIYEAVLEANLAVQKVAKPGVSWLGMHLLANRTLLTQLLKGGLLQGDVDEMLNAGLGYTFQPHGLGHLLGLDLHDVGGYLPRNPSRGKDPTGVHTLRTSRDLLEGMILTIEPGCYFIDDLLDSAINDPKLNKFLIVDIVNSFRGFGGVRIEDDVLITATGCENLTKVPRTVQEIEDWIAGKDDAKYSL